MRAVSCDARKGGGYNLIYSEFLRLSCFAEVALCGAVVYFLVLRGRWLQYWALGCFLIAQASSDLLLSLMIARKDGYAAYFYVYWIAVAIGSVLTGFVIYGAFRLALSQLRGLQRAGSRLLCGIGLICAALAVFSPFRPYFSELRYSLNGPHYIVVALSQLQRMQSVLTLCIVLCILGVAREVGLSYRSAVVGVTLGLGVRAALDLTLSVWLTHRPAMYLQFGAVHAVTIMAALSLWAVYLALPERSLRLIDLPNNSLLARWNRTCLTWTEKL
jgi:hypothetical protein